MDKARAIALLRRRLPLRFHMFVILSTTMLAGIGASKLLWYLGLNNLLVRYPLIVLVSYAVFFAVVRLWLWLVAGGSAPAVAGVVDGIGGDLPLPRIGGTAARAAGRAFSGGSFGGGGASGSLGNLAAAVPVPSPDLAGSAQLAAESAAEGASSGIGDAVGGVGGAIGDALGDDLGIGLVIAAIALVVLLLAVFGIGAYLVWQGPAILTEAAFNTVLAAGLARTSKQVHHPDWAGSLFGATWKPCALIFIAACLAGWAMHRYLPHATRVGDVIADAVAAFAR